MIVIIYIGKRAAYLILLRLVEFAAISVSDIITTLDILQIAVIG